MIDDDWRWWCCCANANADAEADADTDVAAAADAAADAAAVCKFLELGTMAASLTLRGFIQSRKIILAIWIWESYRETDLKIHPCALSCDRCTYHELYVD